MARKRTPSRSRQRREQREQQERYEQLALAAVEAVLFLAGVAWILHLIASGIASSIGADPTTLWEPIGSALGVDPAWIRLLLFSAVHLWILWAARRPMERAVVRLEALILPAVRRLRAVEHPAARRLLAGSGAALGAALGIAFLLQPTLVPWSVDGRSWLWRAANLADGTASASVVDSVAGLVRRLTAEPVRSTEVVDASAFDATLAWERLPLMDRWDPYLLEAAGGDRELFAKTKAFMWVESGGRQFALSSTGCAGLMQFCASTAQRRPFGSLFGVGAVSACGCEDCSVPRGVQIALETDPEAARIHADTFPCDLSDARFDPERSIRAGVAFVRELGQGVGGHLPLMYIGYNSGPRIARSLYRTLGPQEEITLDEIRPHLADALRRYHGKRADARADGLLSVHLPKLLEAWERWKP